MSSPPRAWCSAMRRPRLRRPRILPLLWWIGGLMICLGGYWFWFFIRADVTAEGNSPLRIMRADLFILSLLAQRDAGPDLGLPASEGELRRQRVLRLVHHCHDGAVRIGTVVQVRSHVFQARGGVREKGFLRERLQEQPARPRRQARAVRQRSQNSPGTTDQPTTFTSGDKDRHANLRLHDPVRRLRALRRHLPVRHHAHRQDLLGGPTTSSRTCAGSATPA